jgi:hypothetical protein
VEGLRRHQDKIRFILIHHEEAAAFMATAYAKATGEIGACLATSGPGGIRLLNGLYDAKFDHMPVLAITGMQEPPAAALITNLQGRPTPSPAAGPAPFRAWPWETRAGGHTMSRSVTAALVDVDGALVDTKYLHAVTWWEAFGQGRAPAAKPAPWPDRPAGRIHRRYGLGRASRPARHPGLQAGVACIGLLSGGVGRGELLEAGAGRPGSRPVPVSCSPRSAAACWPTKRAASARRQPPIQTDLMLQNSRMP